jgi:TRAP-type C4-dicarboxylate transport system substrate-binding protein
MGHNVVSVLIMIGSVAPSVAQQTVVKMGTLAPEGSPWHQVLQQMGERWRKASDGKVKLTIYPGGVLGDEPDMVNKMRIGQIQAAGVQTKVEVGPPIALSDEDKISRAAHPVSP